MEPPCNQNTDCSRPNRWLLAQPRRCTLWKCPRPGNKPEDSRSLEAPRGPFAKVGVDVLFGAVAGTVIRLPECEIMSCRLSSALELEAPGWRRSFRGSKPGRGFAFSSARAAINRAKRRRWVGAAVAEMEPPNWAEREPRRPVGQPSADVDADRWASAANNIFLLILRARF